MPLASVDTSTDMHRPTYRHTCLHILLRRIFIPWEILSASVSQIQDQGNRRCWVGVTQRNRTSGCMYIVRNLLYRFASCAYEGWQVQVLQSEPAGRRLEAVSWQSPLVWGAALFVLFMASNNWLKLTGLITEGNLLTKVRVRIRLC